MRRLVLIVTILAAVGVVVGTSCRRDDVSPAPEEPTVRETPRDAPRRARVAPSTPRSRTGETATSGAPPAVASAEEEPAQADALTLPLEVTFHDAETWAPVAVQIRAHTTRGSSPTARADGSWAFDAGVDDGELGVWLDVVPPAGYVPQEVSLRNGVSPLATELSASIAVRPEARILVRVVDEHGVPVADAFVACGGGVGAVSTADCYGDGIADESGELWLRGVPFLRDQPLVLFASHGGRCSAPAEVRLARRNDALELRLVLRPAGEFEDRIIKDAKVSDHNEIDHDLEAEDRVPPRTIRVGVFRRDGRPAAGVSVLPEIQLPESRWATLRTVETDASGRADVGARAQPGTYRVTAAAVGFVPTTQEISLGAGRALETVAIHESRGRRVLVRVLDVDGRPAPFVEVKVWSRHGRFQPMDGDRQELLLHADGHGELVLAHAPLAGLSLSAAYGDRRANVRLEKGESVVLQLARYR